MRQKARADIQRRLLIALIASALMATTHAQVTHIDFQVIHLPRTPGRGGASTLLFARKWPAPYTLKSENRRIIFGVESQELTAYAHGISTPQ